MVATYEIMGRKVGSHVLAMITLGSTFAVAGYSMSGKKKVAEKGPALNAGSKDEEQFIQDFIKQNSAEGQKAKQ